LLAVWCVALVLFSGVFPVLATALFAIAAIALGEWILGRASLALQCACGVALLAGVMGWLLPLPIHSRWFYLALCTVLIVLRRGALMNIWHAGRKQWQAAMATSPRTAVFAMIALGLASTGCWLPTMQFDDLAYHLRLPWELMENARYSMDPRTHVWVFGPWLGDVVQAIAQVIAGAEARGPVNALWMALAAAGVWQLTASLGGTPRINWMAVALYASLPLTAALAGSMQTETATVALLVWLAVAAVQVPDESGPRAVLAGAILVGGLIALKLTGGAFALLLLPLAFWRHRGQLRARDVLLGALLVLVIGGSSYVYASVLTGNPVFPLFNEWFKSPSLPEVLEADQRWHAGFNALLPWKLTFDTDQYQELSDGGAGFLLVALAGAWLLALSDRRTRAMALVVTLLVALPLMHMQYLRYVFPALVLMLPLLALAAFRADPRRAAWLLAGVCMMNLAFQANGHWMLRGGAVKQTVLALGRDAPLFTEFVPERNLIALLREHPRSNGNRGNVLLLDGGNPNLAELGLRGRTVTWYDPELRVSARKAEADASGATWARLMRDEGIAEVILRPETLTRAQRAALARMHAVRRASVGKAEWWSLSMPVPQRS
ncbi:MAG TPA: hypothetical protein VET30_05465, partial [Pseudoxanthomonas sp.]|nr:hypothetical protein [Pseudoxanthomonas sp.]